MLFFGKRRPKIGRIATIIGQGTEIEGDLSFHEGLHIDGTVKGSVKAIGNNGVLIISELGVVEGDLHAPIVILNGTVSGNVFASDRLELAENAKVDGDLTYKTLEMSVGAEINGRLLHVEDISTTTPLLQSRAAATATETLDQMTRRRHAIPVQSAPTKS